MYAQPDACSMNLSVSVCFRASGMRTSVYAHVGMHRLNAGCWPFFCQSRLTLASGIPGSSSLRVSLLAGNLPHFPFSHVRLKLSRISEVGQALVRGRAEANSVGVVSTSSS